MVKLRKVLNHILGIPGFSCHSGADVPGHSESLFTVLKWQLHHLVIFSESLPLCFGLVNTNYLRDDLFPPAPNCPNGLAFFSTVVVIYFPHSHCLMDLLILYMANVEKPGKSAIRAPR